MTMCLPLSDFVLTSGCNRQTHFKQLTRTGFSALAIMSLQTHSAGTATHDKIAVNKKISIRKSSSFIC